MYDIIKEINDTTCLAECDGCIFTLKKIHLDDMKLYKALEGIDNPHIVKIKGFTNVGNDLYVVMQYVQGVTLDRYIEQNDCLTDDRAKNIACQLCDGVAALCERRIVHRDINPNNIIITDDFVAVIIDFGISRFEKPNQNADTQILGTPGYASPEQFGFEQTDEKSDIYSLGVTINFMKTGFLPNEKMCAGTLEPIVRKCIQIDRDKRYQSVSELKNALTGTPINGFIRILRQIPGFRGGKWYFQMPATLYYVTVIALQFSELFDCVKLGQPILYTLLSFLTYPLMLIAPIFALFNGGGWLDRFPYTKYASKPKRIATGIVAAFVMLCVAAEMVTVMSKIKR